MSLKDKLNNNELTIGSWITLGHSAIGEIMARAGFDWLVIDMEHSVIGFGEMQGLIQVIELNDVTPIIRLTSNDESQIKRVMDAGAHGIMVPSVCSAADAERAARSMYYSPRGERGVGLARAQGYGASFLDYRKWLDEFGVLIVMIEHVDAVEAIDEILAVPDVDGFIVGPYDLSGSMGMAGEFERSEVIDAIVRIREGGKRSGKPGGIHVVEPNMVELKTRIADGFKFLGYGLDVRILDTVCRNDLAEIRKSI